MCSFCDFFFSSRRRHTRCALVTGVQTCALPISREVIFTSGATESNNLAIKGAARFHRERRPHAVTLASEHKCVLESVEQLAREGHRVDVLPVGADGLVDLDLLAETVTEETAVVSVMAVNNEIGVIQPLAEIAALCRDKGAYFHRSEEHTSELQSLMRTP